MGVQKLKKSEEKFIDDFYKNFHILKGSPIILYGIGQYTRLILENVEDFKIVGLMDAYAVGQMIYGLPVLSVEEAAERARVIIIVANLSISPVIYRRIKEFVKQKGIKVYYLNGLQPLEREKEIIENPYFHITREKIEEKILEYDIISFDIFDTLLMRKCWKPENVFEIMEKELKADSRWNCFLPKNKDFASIRKEAEKICYRTETEFFTLDMIYNEIGKQLNVPDKIIETWKTLEKEIEHRCLIPRYEMAEVFHDSLEKGKKVILVSDMYLERKFIEEELKRWGIEGYEELFISCEVKRDKYKGKIWEYIKEYFPNRRIFHIGDNLSVDVEKPRNYGVDTFQVASARELVEWSGIKQFWETDHSFGGGSSGGLYGGLFAARAMNSPFALAGPKGVLPISSMEDVGYLFWGPLVMSYLLWLIKTVKEQGVETILFAARDGYILEKMYKKIAIKLNLNVPEGIYFLTSRRASGSAMIRTEEDIRFVVENMCNVSSVSIKALLRNCFGIYIDKNDMDGEKTIGEIGKEAVIQHLLSNYKISILKHAQEERNAYLQYIHQLPIKGKKGFVNFVCRGVTQYCMEKILGEEMIGLYFAAEELEDTFPQNEKIHAWYGKNFSTHTSKENLLIWYLCGEAVFSAPQGQFICFSNEGRPILEEQTETVSSQVRLCHNGIERFIEDIVAVTDRWENLQCDIQLVDKLLGTCFTPAIQLQKDLQEMFRFKDSYAETK